MRCVSHPIAKSFLVLSLAHLNASVVGRVSLGRRWGSRARTRLSHSPFNLEEKDIVYRHFALLIS